MNRLKIIVVLTILTIIPVSGENMGKISCNKNFTATLNFNEIIEFVVVGNNPNNLFYEIFQSDKVCVIRSGNANAPETSITVKLTNGEVWYGTLGYGDNTKIFYDFAKKEEEKKQEMQQAIKEDVVESIMKQRLDLLMSEKPEYYSYGIRENGMELQISNIKNDNQYTYMKVIINNNTGGDYKLDGIFFKYKEGKRKGISKKEAQIEERIFPVHESPVRVIGAYKKEELGFVIPLFSVGDKGNLEIQIREASGTRNPVITIKGKDMLRVGVM